MITEEELIAYITYLGFSKRTPFRYGNEGNGSYDITVLGIDSHGFALVNMIFNRNEEVVFRGRIPSINTFNAVMLLVQEDYTLNSVGIEELKKLK